MEQHLRPIQRQMARMDVSLLPIRRSPRPFWTLGKCVAIAVIAGFGMGVMAILWILG